MVDIYVGLVVIVILFMMYLGIELEKLNWLFFEERIFVKDIFIVEIL